VRALVDSCIRLILLASLFAVGSLRPVDGEAAPAPWRVVILIGADPALPAMQLHDRAMRAAIRSAAPAGVTFFTDTLDTYRFGYAGIAAEFLALQRKKYGGQPVDLVIGVGELALDAVRDQRQALWPEVPLLLSGIDEATLDRRRAPPDAALQLWRSDVDGTLDLVEALQPGVRRLVIAGGNGDFELSIAARVLERARLRARLDPEVWAVFTLEQLGERVAELGTDTAVVFTAMTRDANGRTSHPREALEQIAAVSGAPIYALYGTMLDFGATAGSVVDFEALGRAAGEKAVALLSGRVPVASDGTIAGRCVADYLRLQQYGLSVRSLPAGCDLRNEPRNLWTEYRGFVIAAGAVVALQALTIGGLLVQRRRRLQAELEASERRIELARAMRFAAMGELTASIAHEINQPLGAILSNADAAVLLLRGGAATPEALAEILADIRRDDLRATEVIRRLRALLEKHEVELAPMSLHPPIRDTMALLEPEARRRGVTVELALGATDDGMVGDPVQMQQVLLNLAMNAMDAMESTPLLERRLTIATASGPDGIELTVADRGPGIPAARRESVFESFYTTKSNGMGLGLPIVRAIVDAHHGEIGIESHVGGGTLVRVRLPRGDRAASRVAVAAMNVSLEAQR
jgi:signal transduction histidine kinase